MAKEGIPIPPAFVREKIQQATEVNGLKLSVAENNIAETIIQSMPSKLNGPQLAKWCNAEVDTILQKYPELKDKSDIIRNDVGNELKYFIHKEQFDQLREIIVKERPQKIDTQYIKERNKNLSNFIYENFRNMDGDTDWDFVAKKLGIVDIF